MTGETIAGRYRLLEPLGRGAMSAVWLAHDDELDRRVAVKMLAPSADRARFEREARAVAALSHPNICALYDYGAAEGRPYMVLEHLPHGSLEERLHTGRPLPDEETERIAIAIATGLAHAHERGLVHRDLKPANVLFDAEERPKIADFGIARMGGAGTLTEAGTVLGTASYISPEQAAGLPAGPASDVYSFGVILFRMLTGAFPFVSTNAMELVRMHRDDPPRTVSGERPDAPPRLERIVAASLAKDPADRPPDGAAVLRELLRDDETAAALTAATEATQVLRPRTPARSRRAVVPIAAVMALLLVAGGALAIVLTNDSSNGGTTPPATLTLPSVPSAPSTSPVTTAAATTAATTTGAHTTTAHTTTATTTAATTAPPTQPATTAPATTAPATTTLPPTTTAAPPTTTTAVTTAATTTDQGTTTTAVP